MASAKADMSYSSNICTISGLTTTAEGNINFPKVITFSVDQAYHERSTVKDLKMKILNKKECKSISKKIDYFPNERKVPCKKALDHSVDVSSFIQVEGGVSETPIRDLPYGRSEVFTQLKLKTLDSSETRQLIELLGGSVSANLTKGLNQNSYRLGNSIGYASYEVLDEMNVHFKGYRIDINCRLYKTVGFGGWDPLLAVNFRFGHFDRVFNAWRKDINLQTLLDAQSSI